MISLCHKHTSFIIINDPKYPVNFKIYDLIYNKILIFILMKFSTTLIESNII